MRDGYVIGRRSHGAEQIWGASRRAGRVYAIECHVQLLTACRVCARDHMAVMYQHVQGKARPPQEVNPQLPAELGETVVKAMSVDKAKRYQSMDELRAALERFL